MFRRLGLNALCALCCFALTGAVLGQTNRATINGTIADQNGAAVPGATIKIEQSATGRFLQGMLKTKTVAKVAAKPSARRKIPMTIAGA